MIPAFSPLFRSRLHGVDNRVFHATRRVLALLLLLFVAAAASAGPRIGVLLGTFDPPHVAHLEMAKRAIDRLQLDHLYIVPNYAPPHKPSATRFEYRHAMVRLLTLRFPNMHIFDIPAFEAAYREDPDNINRVLIDDIRRLHGTDIALYQIVGADSLVRMIEDKRLPAASEPRILAAYRRSGYVMPDSQELADLEHRGQLVWIDEALPELSSTAIREALAANQPIPPEQIAPCVLAYIKRNGLYGARSIRPGLREIIQVSPDGVAPRPLSLRAIHGENAESCFVPASLSRFLDLSNLAEPLSLDVDRYLEDRIPASVSRLLLSGEIDLNIVAGLYPRTLELPRHLGFTELWPFLPSRDRIDLVYLFGYRQGKRTLFVTNLFGRDRLIHTLSMFGNLYSRNGLDPQNIKIFIDREFADLNRRQIDESLGSLRATPRSIIMIGYRGPFEFVLADMDDYISAFGLKKLLSTSFEEFERWKGDRPKRRNIVPMRGNAAFGWQENTLNLRNGQRLSFIALRNCYGDQAESLFTNLIGRGFKRFILFGNGGALSSRVAQRTVYAPTLAVHDDDHLTVNNRSWPRYPSRSILKASTPLEETMGWLARSRATCDLVDVENYDVARALVGHPDVALYSGLLVFDVPGQKDLTKPDENVGETVTAKRRFVFWTLQEVIRDIVEKQKPSNGKSPRAALVPSRAHETRGETALN